MITMNLQLWLLHAFQPLSRSLKLSNKSRKKVKIQHLKRSLLFKGRLLRLLLKSPRRHLRKRSLKKRSLRKRNLKSPSLKRRKKNQRRMKSLHLMLHLPPHSLPKLSHLLPKRRKSPR